MRKILIITLAIIGVSLDFAAQSRSGAAYEFLDLPTTSRSTALGGQHATLGETEAGFLFQNPAVLSDTLSRSISLCAAPIAGAIVSSRAAYVHSFSGIGTFGVGVNYINYGTIEGMDEEENYLGVYRSQEAAIYLSYGRALTPHWQIGATLKPVFSSFAGYSSVALAMDMGARYVSESKLFTAGIVFSNIGGQISAYHDDASHEQLDADMRIGITAKPEHAPFRFSLTLKDMFHWDLSIDRSRPISFGDNLLRHTVWGVEFLPIRNFFVGFGYNHRMRKELRESSTGGACGISWGFGLRVFKIDIAYGNARYHKAGSDNVISISTNLDRFL